MFHLQLVTLSGTKYDGDVHEVILPTLDGQIGVLQGHMPLISAAAEGIIYIRKNAKDSDRDREFFVTHGGVIEIENNKLRVIVDEADAPDEINEHEAQSALSRAEGMRTEAKDQVSLEHAQQLIDRSAVRLQVAGLKRRHQR